MTAERHKDGQKGGGKKKLCGANKTNGGGTCKQPAGWDTDHTGHGRCKWHGGCTPSHVNAAKREALQEAVETYGLPREIDPLDAVIEEVHRCAGHVYWLGLKIRGTEAELVEEPWLLQNYRTERRLLVEVCRAAIAAGYAEREVRIAEQEAALFATALRGIVEDLGVADHPQLGKIVRRHLTLIQETT